MASASDFKMRLQSGAERKLTGVSNLQNGHYVAEFNERASVKNGETVQILDSSNNEVKTNATVSHVGDIVLNKDGSERIITVTAKGPSIDL